MHSIKVIAAGLALLFILHAVAARILPGIGIGIRIEGSTLLAAFSVLWLCISAINLMIGMRHGYGLMEELPFFLLVFGVPMAAALIVWKWL